MTPRRVALMCSPGIVVLLGSLAWAVGDRWHMHAVDRGARLFDGLRNVARM